MSQLSGDKLWGSILLIEMSKKVGINIWPEMRCLSGTKDHKKWRIFKNWKFLNKYWVWGKFDKNQICLSHKVALVRQISKQSVDFQKNYTRFCVFWFLVLRAGWTHFRAYVYKNFFARLCWYNQPIELFTVKLEHSGFWNQNTEF